MFHNKADQYLGKVNEWKSQCSSNQVASTVQEAETLLKKHHELSDDISQIYAEVSAAPIIMLYFFKNFLSRVYIAVVILFVLN